MRRYQTAHALAEDIERHLNNEPVLAGRPGTLYRFKKLVRRNTGVFAAVAVVAVVLVLGIAVSTWQTARATRAERTQARLRREAETARAEESVQRRKAEALAYASDMSLAQQSLRMNDLGRARRLLEAHRPAPGEVDLRGWEWRYLWQECRSDTIGELYHYPNSAYSVSYSRDGKVLAVGGFIDRFVELWDVPSRTRIATLQPKAGHVVAFSPCDDLLATDGAENQIRLWRTGAANPIEELSLRGYVIALKFSLDGTRLGYLSVPDGVTVWQVDPLALVHRIYGNRMGGGAHMGALDFSPDGKTLVIGGADHRLQAVDLASGNTKFDILDAHPEPITSVAWSPDGSIIASGSGFSGGPIRLWEAVSGKLLRELKGHTSWICELIFSVDGHRLYSASGDQTIRIWDVNQRRCLATLRGSMDEIYGLALSPDSTTLASASKNGVVAFWNASPSAEQSLPIVTAVDPSGRPAFAPDSRVLAVPLSGTVHLFDLETAQDIEQLPSLGTDVQILAYSPDGTLLVGAGYNGNIRIWSCVECRLLRDLNVSQDPFHLLSFRDDGTQLLAIDRNGRVMAWDTFTWQTVRTFTLGQFASAAVLSDIRLLAVGKMGTLCWLNGETGEPLATMTDVHRHLVVGIAFSPDGLRSASVSEDGTVAIWDLSSFGLITSFKGHMLGAHGVAFSPNGRRLATGSGNREAVKLWDLSTHRELMTLAGQGSIFNFVAFSPDSQWLAACSAEGNLHLWHAPSWGEIEVAEKKLNSKQSP